MRGTPISRQAEISSKIANTRNSRIFNLDQSGSDPIVPLFCPRSSVATHSTW
jgi:hypothetical protein